MPQFQDQVPENPSIPETSKDPQETTSPETQDPQVGFVWKAWTPKSTTDRRLDALEADVRQLQYNSAVHLRTIVIFFCAMDLPEPLTYVYRLGIFFLLTIVVGLFTTYGPSSTEED